MYSRLGFQCIFPGDTIQPITFNMFLLLLLLSFPSLSQPPPGCTFLSLQQALYYNTHIHCSCYSTSSSLKTFLPTDLKKCFLFFCTYVIVQTEGNFEIDKTVARYSVSPPLDNQCHLSVFLNVLASFSPALYDNFLKNLQSFKFSTTST